MYRRSQYSPEVEQQEVEEETAAQLRPAETHRSGSPDKELSESHRPAGAQSDGMTGTDEKSGSELGGEIR